MYFTEQCCTLRGLPGGPVIKNPPPVQETQETRLRSLGQEDPLEEGMATHSSILAWRIPWTEEPGRLQAIGLQSRTRLQRLSRHTALVHTQWRLMISEDNYLS